jgi:hypothetical protein
LEFDVVFKHVRFYRQKFIVECGLTDITNTTSEVLFDGHDDEDLIPSDEEEIASPFEEDLEAIKNVYSSMLTDRIQKLKSEASFIQAELDKLNKVYENIDEYTPDDLYKAIEFEKNNN